MNLTEKIKLKIELDELAVLQRLTSVIPLDSFDANNRMIFSIMLRVNTYFTRRLAAHQHNRGSVKVSMSLEYFEGYALCRFLRAFTDFGSEYENNVVRKIIHYIAPNL